MSYKIINPKQEKLRAFYRIFILPRHVEIRSGAEKKKLKDELDEHIEWVKENKLGVELKAYVKAQQTRQDCYDKVAKLRSELSVVKGTDLNKVDPEEIMDHVKLLADKAKEVTAAEEAFEASKEAFTAAYGNPAGVAMVSKG